MVASCCYCCCFVVAMMPLLLRVLNAAGRMLLPVVTGGYMVATAATGVPDQLCWPVCSMLQWLSATRRTLTRALSLCELLVLLLVVVAVLLCHCR